MMSVVIDFRNPALNNLTTWTNVQLSYLVVSAARYETLPANAALIWATNVEVHLATGSITNGAILYDGFFAHTETDSCGLTYTGSAYVFNTLCTTAQYDVAIHAYIMGFQFQPDAAVDQVIAASIIWPGLTTVDDYTVGKSTPTN